ncbi:MAG: SBBP repeat-containing protein [Acidobacteria bacterium]|nr:SBBP repeat-containing protein [Acidobacteriota bacterium]
MLLALIASSTASAAPSVSALSALPTRFESNQGQWPAGEKFRARTDGYSLSFDERGATLYLASKQRSLRFAPVNANAHPAVTGMDPMRARANYLTGRDKSKWQFGVPLFQKVRYREVYPGVDLDYYGQDGRLEFDFIVSPNTGTAAIRMQVTGADRTLVNGDGDLVIEVAGERILQKKPLLYQIAANGTRERVEGGYRMAGRNSVGFSIGRYDRGRELVIDPTLFYSTLIGGTGNDAITAVKVDSGGFLYIAGYITGNAYKAAVAGGTDIVVAKIDPNIAGGYSLLGMTYLGGGADDKPTAMAVDKQGNVYLTGTTLSGDFPLVAAPQQTLGGDMDAFVVMINPMVQGSGALYVSSYLGGKNTDIGNAIALDGAGSVYVFGTTRSDNYPVTSSTAGQAVRWGVQNCFLTKFTPGSTSLTYSSYFGGDYADDGRAMAVTRAGIVYAAGSTYSDQLQPVGEAYKTVRQGLDIFIARMDLSKAPLDVVDYVTFFGGSGMDEVRSMTLDNKERPVLTGYTASADFPTTPNAFQKALKGPANAFVSVVDPGAPSGRFLVYSTYLGGSSGEVGYGVATDPGGRIYVTGYTMSADFPVTGDAFEGGSSQAIYVFLTKLDPSRDVGQLAYSTCLGTAGINVGLAIAAGADGTIYAGGHTGPGFIQINEKAFQVVFNGGTQDGFIVVVKP